MREKRTSIEQEYNMRSWGWCVCVISLPLLLLPVIEKKLLRNDTFPLQGSNVSVNLEAWRRKGKRSTFAAERAISSDAKNQADNTTLHDETSRHFREDPSTKNRHLRALRVLSREGGLKLLFPRSSGYCEPMRTAITSIWLNVCVGEIPFIQITSLSLSLSLLPPFFSSLSSPTLFHTSQPFYLACEMNMLSFPLDPSHSIWKNEKWFFVIPSTSCPLMLSWFSSRFSARYHSFMVVEDKGLEKYTGRREREWSSMWRTWKGNLTQWR